MLTIRNPYSLSRLLPFLMLQKDIVDENVNRVQIISAFARFSLMRIDVLDMYGT